MKKSSSFYATLLGIIIFSVLLIGGIANAQTQTPTESSSTTASVVSAQDLANTVVTIKSAVTDSKTQIVGLVEQIISDSIRDINASQPPVHGRVESLNATIEVSRQKLLTDIDSNLNGGAGLDKLNANMILVLGKIINFDLNTIKKELKPETVGVKLDSSANEQRIQAVLNGLAAVISDQQKNLKAEKGDLLFKDSNHDGISDYDSVYVYNIDPNKPAPTAVYEGKQVTNADKLSLGFDPSQAGLVKINYQDVKTVTAPISSAYKVNTVKLDENKKVVLGGQSLPNSFITLYIYSTPIIVTVKANADGEWSYILDKELENGNHSVYTASVNNSGKILAKGPAFAFVKTASAAEVSAVPADVTGGVSKPGLLEDNNALLIIGIFLGLVFLALIIVGISGKGKGTIK